MDDWPSLSTLAVVDRGRLCSTLDERGTPVWRAEGYRFEWERERATWDAVGTALHDAVRRQGPETDQATPPR